MFAIGSDELEQLPDVTLPILIQCPHCQGEHVINKASMLGFYQCGDDSYLASISGKLLFGLKVVAAPWIEL